uniref:Uncharacterized protein AlNc14C289G10209 n=1 Tax=Albugo laibachii Nc14 TaxID=890382 RepID=F0WV64_9STRA|nr:conserved hypothetical protein [Albugo laibachii Nc14]|eukprot:CCA25303.1 conserved hypothetical protein [Albugo laibachii Nc14]
MILFTSASTTLQFAIAGQFPGSLQYDYVDWFACAGFVGAYCGQNVVAFLLKKYNREPVMVYILAVLVSAAHETHNEERETMNPSASLSTSSSV